MLYYTILLHILIKKGIQFKMTVYNPFEESIFKNFDSLSYSAS